MYFYYGDIFNLLLLLHSVIVETPVMIMLYLLIIHLHPSLPNGQARRVACRRPERNFKR